MAIGNTHVMGGPWHHMTTSLFKIDMVTLGTKSLKVNSCNQTSMPINRSVNISFKVEGEEKKVTREQGIIEEIDSRKKKEQKKRE